MPFIHLNNSGPGAEMWLGNRIARARPGVPVNVTSSVFRIMPDHMPQTITLWPKPVTRQMVRDVAEGRKPAPLPPIALSIALYWLAITQGGEMSETFKTTNFPVRSYTSGHQVVGIEAFAADYVEPGRVGIIRIMLDDEWLGLVTGD